MVPMAPCWNEAPGKLEGGTAWRTPSSELCQRPSPFPNDKPTAQSNGNDCSLLVLWGCGSLCVPSANLKCSPEPNTTLQPSLLPSHCHPTAIPAAIPATIPLPSYCHPTAIPLPSLLPSHCHRCSQPSTISSASARAHRAARAGYGGRCDLFLSKPCRAEGLSHCARRKSGSKVGRKELCPPQDLTAAPWLCRGCSVPAVPSGVTTFGHGVGEGMDHHGAVLPFPWGRSAAFPPTALPQRCVGVKAAALTHSIPVVGSAVGAFPTPGLGKAGNTKHHLRAGNQSWIPTVTGSAQPYGDFGLTPYLPTGPREPTTSPISSSRAAPSHPARGAETQPGSRAGLLGTNASGWCTSTLQGANCVRSREPYGSAP